MASALSRQTFAVFRQSRAEVGLIGRSAAQRKDVRLLRPDREGPGFLYVAVQQKFLSFITKRRIETRQAPVEAFQKYARPAIRTAYSTPSIFATCWKVRWHPALEDYESTKPGGISPLV